MSPSETILISLIEMNSYVINWRISIEQNFFERLTYWFVFINMVHMIYATGAILVGLVLYTGFQQYDMWFHFTVMVLLLPLGYILRRTETLILLIAFILQDKLLMSSNVLYNLHFG